jgi:hypothetical protein
MGLRGVLSKSVEQIKSDDVELSIPKAGIDLDPIVQEEWDDFWLSKVSRFTDDVDMGTLRRLFTYRNEWTTLQRTWIEMDDDSRIVEGSNRADALRSHPFADRLDKLEKLMLPLEDRFGLSPLSRARLGIEVGQHQLTWRQVQQGTYSSRTELPVGTAGELGT